MVTTVSTINKNRGFTIPYEFHMKSGFLCNTTKTAQPPCDVHGGCAVKKPDDALQVVPVGTVFLVIPEVAFSCPGRAVAAATVT